MRNEYYYKIYGWMKNVYKLRGNSLEVYAALYSLTKKTSWTGTMTTLAGYMDVQLDTLKRACKLLENKGLLSIENIAYSTYSFQALHPKKTEIETVAAELKKGKQAVTQNAQVVTQNEQVVTQNEQVVTQNEQDLKERSKENINNILNKKENNNRGGAKVEFCPPRWEEVYEYCKSKLVPIDTAKAFYCYYEANGWRMSKGCRVRKWQALLMKWDIDNHQREKEQSARAATRYQAGNQITREQAAERARQLEAERVAREQADAEYEASKNDAETQAEIAAIHSRHSRKISKEICMFRKKVVPLHSIFELSKTERIYNTPLALRTITSCSGFSYIEAGKRTRTKGKGQCMVHNAQCTIYKLTHRASCIIR